MGQNLYQTCYVIIHPFGTKKVFLISQGQREKKIKQEGCLQTICLWIAVYFTRLTKILTRDRQKKNILGNQCIP